MGTLGTAIARRRQAAQDQGGIRRRAHGCRRQAGRRRLHGYLVRALPDDRAALRRALRENPDVVFVKVDVDENQETAAACGINCMPTFQFYKNGAKTFEMQGADPNQLTAKVAALK